MNNELALMWQDLATDIASPVIVWQLSIIILSLVLAGSINGLLKAYVMKHAPETWKVGIGGINRVLFPLSSLILIYIGQLILSNWQHTSMLKLADKLLIAMAVIRLVVYALRYIFSSGGWVRAMEHLISTIVWLILAFHLSGLLPDIILALEDISFTVGKNHINLLLILQGLLTVVITLIGALWVSRVIENRLMNAAQINMNMRVVLSKLIRICFSLIAVLIALSAVGLDITLLSVFGGALGVGIGFGLQKIASNYISGFIILIDKSMQMGDVITIDNHYGIVSDLRSRYLVLRKLDGTQVVIPNETLITSSVVNHSFTERKARVQMPIQVSYESNLEKAMGLMLECAKNHPRVMQDTVPTVNIAGFGESGIDLNLNIWIPDPEEGSASLKSAIYLEIWRAFQANSIVIPYPQREVRVLSNMENSKPSGLDV
ncbi:mechanosensitive ion channel protein MscS [Methylovorus sp. MM2]|uniref:mechanosensitive ion channel family protein n=1 Tax=Methylovorus sp. MM2 TaxID=1848038 RepID=UPI0007E0B5D0|nr:mechanosensitive ion channel domain-containing protein [Methylovorus sp. MM2]OAM51667.1 mechanosensitive ion channel protein MscS [Methylovorus sp. MM2]